MHKISMKTIFKEPIFTAVESKIQVHIFLMEHVTAPAELTTMLRVTW